MRADQRKTIGTLLWVLLIFYLSADLLYTGYTNYRDYSDSFFAFLSFSAAFILAAIGVRTIWRVGSPRPRSEAEKIDGERDSAVLGCLALTVMLLGVIYLFKGSSSIAEARPLFILAVGVVVVFLIAAAGIWFATRKLKARVVDEYKWSHLFEPVIDHLEWFAGSPGNGREYDEAIKTLSIDRDVMRSECQRVLGTLEENDKSTAAGITAGLELVEGWCDKVPELKNS